ncbi:uncharacterized protein LTR77_001835 [Saxophila tyrrhenica]|uniref:VASt domain-containing protein n=1 Tax=Saxophila tyrrhenica TaxID=1690608 RepID=A0AAV9PN85_9PEZI|nr:hypothetical protein LTR77_001835 [Saxophila tyrrhenica]
MSAPDVNTPPSRGLSRLLRNQGDSKNNSTNSLVDSSNSDDQNPESAVGLRPGSSRGVGERLADRIRRKSVDDRRDSAESAKRLSSFIPSRRNKLKRNKSSERQAESREPSPVNESLTLAGNQSDSSLAQEGSGRSSLLTDDNSDQEGRPVRPTLSAHPSHIGYLTLSSPEINAQAVPTPLGDNGATAPGVAQSTSTSSIPQIIEPLDAGSTSTFRDSNSSETARANEQPSPAAKVAQEAAYTSHAPAAKVEAIQQQSDERPVTPKSLGRPRVNTASLPATPPNLSETPTTFVTPPTPTDPNAEFPRRPPRKATTTRQRSDSSSSYESIKHRRNQSANLPSKLSQSVAVPLTPHVEETKTPGGTLVQPPPGTGFFSSFFSAAQKTANQLGSSIAIGGNQKSRVSSQTSADGQGGEEVIPGLESSPNIIEGDKDRQLAVDTLGKGNLNLGHLGISEEPAAITSNALEMQNGAPAGGEASNKAEEEAAARAVSDAYEKPVAAAVSEATGGHRPMSIASNDRLTLTGDQTPPRHGADFESIKRSGSVRSKLSGRRRKHRGSSATAGTGNTIAAGLTATASGFQNLAASGAGHRLTGFAVASSKRNKDFHSLFRSVPEDDYLIEDYSAALQRDILLHGRLYVSEGHICFSSNILGWVTNLVISFDEVVSVEKKTTAVIFPNAIVISTLQARNTFASFVARDSTYELIIGIWKISHPNLKSSLNGVSLDNAGTGDKTEVAEPEGSEDGSDTGSEDEVYDEDADDDGGSFNDASLAPSIAGSDLGDPTLSRKASGLPLAPGAAQANGVGAKTNGISAKGFEGTETAAAGATATADFPGPPSHEATQCSESGEHYTNLLIDTVIPAPLGKVYSMTFGPASGAFMTKWLVEDQKSRELNFTDDKIGLDNDHKTMTFDYIKPLSGSIGPRQTKCITTNTLVAFDLDRAVSIDCSTQTPDVPSGNVFMTKTRYCLMWAPGNSTRFLSTSAVEWSGKSPIEKGTQDGQTEYAKALTAAVKAAVTTRPPVKGPLRKGKRKGKKEMLDTDASPEERKTSVTAERKETTWGPLEPLHAILRPVISLLDPFMNSQVLIAVLTVLLLYTWISPPARRGGTGVGLPGYSTPERLLAYEEIWRHEESNLWDWLEDRVGLDNIYVPSGGEEQKDRQKVLAARNMAKKLGDERMSERQMDDAIRVTQERLESLKDAVARKKGGKKEL